MAARKDNKQLRTLQIEEVFGDYKEYESYFLKALSLFQDLKKKRNPSLAAYVPEALEVQFSNSIKAPRIRMPRYQSTIVVELPGSGLSPKKKSAYRERALIGYSPVIKKNEVYMADEFAMRLKLLERSKRRR